MSKDIKNLNPENENLNDDSYEIEICTLIDDEGVEHEFELIMEKEIDGVTYSAFIPYSEDQNYDDPENLEYYIFKQEADENGEIVFSTIDDDDEYDKIADIFGDITFDDELCDCGCCDDCEDK